MKVKFMFKNGTEIITECECCKIYEDSNAKIYAYDIRGIKSGKPLYIDVEEILAVVEVE